jgi:hypothetical protein
LFLGDRTAYDVAAPMRAGMQACLVQHDGPAWVNWLPERALVIGHVCELAAILELA